MILLVFLAVAAQAASGQETLPPPASETNSSPGIGFLIEALENRDESIRREALRRLEEDETPAVAPQLVKTLRHAERESATRAALALAGRLELQRRSRDPLAPRPMPAESDARALASVGEILQQSGIEHWRWYLAEWVLEQSGPDALEQELPALIAAVRGALPMRQYAATRAMVRLGERAGAEARSALIEALRQPYRPSFVGLYLRYERVIERNAVAFTADVWARAPGSRQLRFFADNDLLITAALLATGAGYEELGAPLTILSRHENESVRLEAARQLTQLGAGGRPAADAALAVLLADRRSPLVRQLAEEDAPSREEAIELIARLNSQAREVIMPLTALLDSNEDRLRQSAAIALGRLGNTARPALPALRRAVAMESLLAGAAAVVSPESKARARERLDDMRKAVRQIEKR